MIRLVFSVVVTSILFGSLLHAIVEKDIVPSLPLMENFLEFLFAANMSTIVDIANNFEFYKTVPRQVFFRWYHPDGRRRIYPANLRSGIPIVNLSLPTKFIVHGWQSGGLQEWTKKMAEEYHSIGIKNVIVVDWSEHAKGTYLTSAKHVMRIGDVVGDFVLKLMKDKEQLNNVHFVGHCLGAHIAGFAAKRVRSEALFLISRITALDAAGPLFETPSLVSESRRLHLEDAQFMDSIHTNIGFLGFSSDIAQADFYVGYGGPIQPGCWGSNFYKSFLCSHLKAYKVFSNSIGTKAYTGRLCTVKFIALMGFCNWNEEMIMGEHVQREANGSYYLNVDDKNRPV